MSFLRAHAKLWLGVHFKFIRKGLKLLLDANSGFFGGVSFTLISVAPGLLPLKLVHHSPCMPAFHPYLVLQVISSDDILTVF